MARSGPRGDGGGRNDDRGRGDGGAHQVRALQQHQHQHQHLYQNPPNNIAGLAMHVTAQFSNLNTFVQSQFDDMRRAVQSLRGWIVLTWAVAVIVLLVAGRLQHNALIRQLDEQRDAIIRQHEQGLLELTEDMAGWARAFNGRLEGLLAKVTEVQPSVNQLGEMVSSMLVLVKK